MSRIIRSQSSVKSLVFDKLTQEPSAVEHQSAQELLADAHRQAASIVAQAEQQAGAIRQSAHEQGYREGLDKAADETAEALQTIVLVAQEAFGQKWKVVRGAESNIIELALEIAEKIVAEHVKLSPATVASVAQKALMLAVEREHLVIRVNHEDLEEIKTAKEDLMCTMDGIEKIEVIADRRIRRGGCVIETSAGSVDARIESQLSEVKESLKGAVGID